MSMATATTINEVRENWNMTEQSTVWMTVREFAQTPHNLDRRNSDWAYTPTGEKWVYSDTTQLWIRVCWEGFKKHYRLNGRRK